MVCYRRIPVVGGVVRCLSDVVQPVCLMRTCWFPPSIEVICEWCFSSCKSLTSVRFDTNSQLSRLEKQALFGSRLHSIHLLASLEVICESCFHSCKSLESVTFDANSRLSHVEIRVRRNAKAGTADSHTGKPLPLYGLASRSASGKSARCCEGGRCKQSPLIVPQAQRHKQSSAVRALVFPVAERESPVFSFGTFCWTQQTK
jgi:hypothetical protein